jgi:hypothetical protein
MPLERFPGAVVATHTERGAETYLRVDTAVAFPRELAASLPGELLFELPGAGLAVCTSDADGVPAALDDSAIAVYRHEGGTLCVPTGRSFVQFEEHDRANRHAGELHEAGVALDQVPGYAPHAAWVRPLSGKPEDGLRAIGQLARIDGVAAVEPEMLSPVSRRQR